MSLKTAAACIDNAPPPPAFDLGPQALAEIIGPMSAADDALARLDERLRKSPVRGGVLARLDAREACAALWAEAELVQLEDLVLHDAGMDVRSPSHELVRAHSYLRLRRRAAEGDPKALLRPEGILRLAGRSASGPAADGPAGRAGGSGEAEDADPDGRGFDGDRDGDSDEFAAEQAGASAAAAAAQSLLLRLSAGARDSLVYDEDWDEAGRLKAWSAGLTEADAFPPLLGALLLARAWRHQQPLQRQGFLAPVLAALYLRRRGRTVAHLLVFHLGLRRLKPALRRLRTPLDDLQHSLAIVAAGAGEALALHDRLTLARELLARKCKGKRGSSNLPALAELLLEAPLVSVPLIAQRLKISPQAAQLLVAELGSSLREITGRKRYRAWTIG
ncbi:RHE_PE00001 family protein [Methylocapsa palsarum]|nr:RHE_PE00001 family protein [Methylocapsa palsarum]